MVYQMWTPMVPAAGQQAQRIWEAQATREEVGGARQQHRGQVVPVEILMI